MEMFQKMDKCDIMMLWGRSSVDRALHSHCRGREFESHRLHHFFMPQEFYPCKIQNPRFFTQKSKSMIYLECNKQIYY